MNFNKINKKGLNPAISIVLFLVIVVVAIFAWDYFYTKPGNQFSWDDYLTNSAPVGDLLGYPGLNWLSYVVGQVPEAITVASTPIGSAIVIILVWVILLLMFGDILSLFGSFSTVTPSGGGTPYSPVAWIIGIFLAVIAANFKVVMAFAGLGFMLISGFGALAAILGVVTPFLIYIVVHTLFLKELGAWFMRGKNATKFKTGVADIEQGIEGAKAFGKAVRKP